MARISAKSINARGSYVTSYLIQKEKKTQNETLKWNLISYKAKATGFSCMDGMVLNIKVFYVWYNVFKENVKVIINY